MKIDKLSKLKITDAIALHRTYRAAVDIISARMNYVIKHCLSKVGGKLEWWDWPNEDASSDADGDFIRGYNEVTTQIVGKWSNGDKMLFISKDGGEWSLRWGEFPSRWLYEDFEEEYEDGLKLYNELANAAKAKEKESKSHSNELVKSAKAKLTKEERKALGIN